MAGLIAGAVNSVAGGGSLLTFPMLLALGYSPLVANVTNTVGVSLGNVGGVVGYRRELGGRGPDLLRLGAAAAAGSLAGAVILLATPASVFRHVAPVLILIAAVLVLLQPAITRALRRRATVTTPSAWAPVAAVGVISIYGGYFGAAMGVMLIAILGLLLPEALQRTNALKTAITLVVNGISALLFAAFGPVAWGPAVTLAVATVLGGYLGAGLARRLPDVVLRAAVVAIGLVAAVLVATR